MSRTCACAGAVVKAANRAKTSNEKRHPQALLPRVPGTDGNLMDLTVGIQAATCCGLALIMHGAGWGKWGKGGRRCRVESGGRPFSPLSPPGTVRHRSIECAPQ